VHQRDNFRLGTAYATTSKALTVTVTRVRANTDTLSQSESQYGTNLLRVTGVKAAGYTGLINKGHH